MEGKKASRSKSRSKKDQIDSSSSPSEEEKSFVDNLKKRAIVKTHGIDNVSLQNKMCRLLLSSILRLSQVQLKNWRKWVCVISLKTAILRYSLWMKKTLYLIWLVLNLHLQTLSEEFWLPKSPLWLLRKWTCGKTHPSSLMRTSPTEWAWYLLRQTPASSNIIRKPKMRMMKSRTINTLKMTVWGSLCTSDAQRKTLKLQW